MTELRKIVRRVGTVPVHELCGDRLVAALEPGDVFALRQQRRRRWYRASFAELFNLMARIALVSRERAINKRVKELVAAGYSRRTARGMARREVEAEERRQR